jgi:hypothetical protein
MSLPDLQLLANSAKRTLKIRLRACLLLRSAVIYLVLSVISCVITGHAFAQSTLPEAPVPSASASDSAEKPAPVHAFWDKENVLLFSGIAVFRGLDYASTRNMQARGREEILLPDDVVNNSAGFAALEAAATATSVGISYIFHRTGHHQLERWLSIGHISVTGFGAARNYALKSKHPQ